MASRSESTTEFDLAETRGEVARSLSTIDLEEAAARITDPGSSIETLHWGRNYLYVIELESGERPLEAVVKQFRNQGALARLQRRLRGSKAEKSWEVAWTLVELGVPTPRPLLLVESKAAEGPSFFVAERLRDFFEARYYFRALHAARERELYPAIDKQDLLAAIAAVARQLHDGGIRYRDLSIGNLLIRPVEGSRRPEVFLVDPNRARLGARLGRVARLRDLCRLPILDRDDQASFLASYWDGARRPGALDRPLYSLFVRSFLLRNSLKRGVGRPFSGFAGRFKPRRAHVHIPDAPQGASSRDLIVWDQLSDQPHQHAGRLSRALVRLSDVGAHVEALTAVARATPRTWRRFRRLRAGLYEKPVLWAGMGVALRPHPLVEEQLAAVDELGVEHVFLRLHPWDSGHDGEEALARELHARGLTLVFGLPQNRELARNPRRWEAALAELAERFVPFGSAFQVGQAINRSKWGLWSYREYLDLALGAAEILRGYPGVEIVGPAAIDFEPYAMAAPLNMKRTGLHFDVASSLLYVDRRGAPESTQMGLDAAGKTALMRAIAGTASLCDDRLWITEFNWPLWEGPHSPAGKTVSVDESAQADYLVRYFVLVLATGLAERAYWWRLIATGYGLIDPREEGGLRRRPSYRAFATLSGLLRGTEFTSVLPVAPPLRAFVFRRPDGGEIVAAWSVDRAAELELPRPVVEAVDRDGARLALAGRRRLEVAGSPVYLRLEGEAGSVSPPTGV